MVQGRGYDWPVFASLSLRTYMTHIETGPEARDNPSSILVGGQLPREGEGGGERLGRRRGGPEARPRTARPRALQSSRPLKVTRSSASLCLPRALSWQKWRHHILAQPRLSIYEGFLTNRQAGHAWVAAFIPHLACLHRTSTISTD